MSDYYDRNGRPIADLLTWCRFFEDKEYCRVAWDPLPGGGHLSTVWLGLNHGLRGGRLQIFESMAFPENDPCVRYATEEEARAGHQRLLAELTKAKEGGA